jgi:hypothetical protein
VILLSVTVVGAVLAWLLFIVLKWLGIAGMFHAFGQRVGGGLGREMSLLGAVLIGFLPFALLVLLPSAFGLAGLVIAGTIGLFFWLFLEVPGVGLAILTAFGSRSNPERPAPAGPPPRPAPPPPPETAGPPPATDPQD